MKWVIDASAVNYIAARSSNYNAVFSELTQLVADGELSFCDEVCDELDRTAENEPGALWATTVRGQRQDGGAGIAATSWVIRNVRDIVDPDARHDSMPYVLALARMFQQDGHQITVITEDSLEKPTRRALSEACTELSIASCDVAEWMATLGIPWP